MDEKRFTLRMDGELFERVSNLAKSNRRSVAKEIELAVEKHLGSYRRIIKVSDESDASRLLELGCILLNQTETPANLGYTPGFLYAIGVPSHVTDDMMYNRQSIYPEYPEI